MNGSAKVLTEFYVIVNHLWQSTVIVILVWGLAFSLRNHSANLRYRLWMFASAKFLVPLSVLIGLGKSLRPAISHASSLPIPQVSDAFARSVQPYAVSVQTIPAAAIHGATGSISADAFWIACVLFWGLGVFIVMAKWLRAWLRLHRIARRGRFGSEVSGIPILICNEVIEPGVFGILNLRILVPEELLTRISTLELEAIYAHELCHVRRKDNLIAALHEVVHSLFWFHPAVWLIRSKMMDERERACDELVLASGVDLETYARSIVNVCKYYVEAPEGVMSGVTGGSLKDRVQRILSNISCERLSPTRKLVIATCILLVAVLPFCLGLLDASQVLAQSAPQPSSQTDATRAFTAGAADVASFQPTFEVVSIHPMSPDDPRSEHIDNPAKRGYVKAVNVNLKSLMEIGYDIPDLRMFGGPTWVTSARFSLEAKADPKLDEELAALPYDQARQAKRKMIAALLVEKFKLSVHAEAKEMSVYAMVIAKGGPKLGETQYHDDSQAAGNQLINIRPGNDTLQILAYELSWRLGTPVLDQTGLHDKQSLKLRWRDDEGTSGELNAPSLSTAIQEQLGLKLESKKASVPVLLIDHAEKPIEN